MGDGRLEVNQTELVMVDAVLRLRGGKSGLGGSIIQLGIDVVMWWNRR